MLPSASQKRLLQTLWRDGPLSRSQLGRRCGMRLNTVGEQTAAMLEAGLLRLHQPVTAGTGRPPVPLAIDSDRRHLLGVAVRPEGVELAKVDLLGEAIGPSVRRRAAGSHRAIRAAGELLDAHLESATLAIGIAAPGFIDPVARRLLFNAAVTNSRGASLGPIYQAAGTRHVVLANDAHALAARWAIGGHGSAVDDAEDTLLVMLGDHQVGASLLINGRPNDGCVHGANELGHTRLPVDSPRCFCGHVGCIETIFSSTYLAQRAGMDSVEPGLLDRMLARFADGTHDKSLDVVIDMLAMVLANAVTFTRVGRLVLSGGLTMHSAVVEALIARIRAYVLVPIRQRLRLDLWQQPAISPAATAAALVLAELYCPQWASSTGGASLPVTLTPENG